MKSRVFNISQSERHPDTGEVLLTEETIKDALSHRTIKRWAYIKHDKDVWTEEDEKKNPKHKAGTVKQTHWHIVIEMGSNQVDTSVIGKWLNIPENFVGVAKGRGAFLDCVEYLTHEDDKQQALGKRLYDDEEVQSNFDFRDELNKRAERKAKYGRDLSEKDMIRNEVLFNGLTLREVAEKWPLIYQEDYIRLERNRLQYLDRFQEMPVARINFYIEGPGGIGKGLASKALARALVDETGEMDDDLIFFEVGSDKASFEGYDGQPVIIWNDCRAFTLLQKLGGRENVFNVFDLFPPKIKQNIKYGSIRLCNRVNIVNSVQPAREFLDGLAGEYKGKNGEVQKAEDKSQSYRRFPLFLVLHEDDFDLYMNRGVYEGSREYLQYIAYTGMQGSLRRISEKCGSNYKLRDELNRRAMAKVKEEHDVLQSKLIHEQEASDQEVMEEFENLGTYTSVPVIKDFSGEDE